MRNDYKKVAAGRPTPQPSELDAPVRAQPRAAGATGTLHIRVVAARQRHRNRERQPWDIAETDRRLALARRALQRERPQRSRPHVGAAEQRPLPQRVRLARLTEVFRKLLVDQLLGPVVCAHAIKLLAISRYASAPGCVDA